MKKIGAFIFSALTLFLLISCTPTSDKYTVTFETNRGTPVESIEVDKDSTLTNLPTTSREGYDFDGWYKETTLQNRWQSSDRVTSNLTLYAKWNEINNEQRFTVRFLDHDDRVISSQSVLRSAAATAPANPERDGYTFSRWSVSFVNITSNLDVRAEYTINSYRVQFKNYDGTVLKTETVNHGSNATAPANPTRSGYEFTGWDRVLTNITSSQDITAQFRALGTVTVRFKDYDDRVIKTENIQPGTGATAPANPARTGYTFTGWSVPFDNVEADLDVIARYTINTYQVRFRNYDGTVLKTETVNHGSVVIAPANPTRTGYEFTGWDRALTNITSSQDITAQFRQITTYTVRFLDHDDTVLSTQQVESGKAATQPTSPTRTGYSFAGWSVSFNNITANLDVKATYTQNQYVVTFVDHDDTVLSRVDVLHGADATAPANPTRTGYTFTKWSVAFTNVTGNLEVKAEYTIMTYTVEFRNADGTVLSTVTVNFGEAATAPANPTMQGGTFRNWNIQFNNVRSNLVVTAVYDGLEHTVRFLDHDGTVLYTTTVANGQEAAAPLDPEREGYTFTGWDKELTSITEDTDVTALYEVEQVFTVRFMSEEGTVISTQQIARGANASAPQAPAREGFVFAGWIGNYNAVTGNIDIVSRYTAVRYLVELKDHDGTIIQSLQVIHGEDFPTPADPFREGYTFTGWDKPLTNVTEARTITAQYSINTFTVIYNDKDGVEISRQTVNFDADATPPTPPTVEGYTFRGWNIPSDKVRSNLTITALYDTVDGFTVEFVDHDGTILAVRNVPRGSNAVAPANPTRTNYVFTGWSRAFTNVQSDLRVVAQYRVEGGYTVTFRSHLGEVIGNVVVAPGEDAVAPNAPQRTGYTFTGWSGSITNIRANVTVDAQYEVSMYIVRFINRRGGIISTQQVGYGQTAVAPTPPEEPNLTFTGWSRTYTNVQSNLDVVAQYTGDTFTVTFQNRQGTVITTDTVARGSDAAAPFPPREDGYTFTGWSVDYTNVQSDLVVRAQYNANTYTVTFLDKDNQIISTVQVTHGENAVFPTPPTFEGYEFSRWSADGTNITFDTYILAQYQYVGTQQ